MVAGIPELFAELDNDLVERSSGTEIVVPPNLVQEPVAGKDFPRVSGEELEQFKFFRGEFFDSFAAIEPEGPGVDCGGADLEACLASVARSGSVV